MATEIVRILLNICIIYESTLPLQSALAQGLPQTMLVTEAGFGPDPSRPPASRPPSHLQALWCREDDLDHRCCKGVVYSLL